MAFDKDDSRPLVETERRTTKVNVTMAIAIIAFFVIASVIVWRLWAHGS